MNNPDILPVVFVSHGSPTTVIEEIPARDFLLRAGGRYPGVRAILCVSAHWETDEPAVGAALAPETIYDFYGFPEEMYRQQYPAPGDPELAERVAGLVRAGGMNCRIDRERGLDHGAWVPLKLMFPAAEIPVAQLSIQHSLDPRAHWRLGRTLEPLRREGVLIVGSGGAVHPLGFARGPEPSPPDWARSFDEWLAVRLAEGDSESLLDYRKRAPFPERAHPRPDHYMPLLAALGAAGPGARATQLHQSWYWGILSLAMYEWAGEFPGEPGRNG